MFFLSQDQYTGIIAIINLKCVMASNGTAMSVSQPTLLIFEGESYEFKSIKMKTLFISLDLWELVEKGYQNPDEETQLREDR